MWSQLQATLGETSEGPWIGWAVISGKVPYTENTAISRQRDHGKTEGDRAEIETMGESPNVYEGAEEGATGYSTEEKDDENEGVGRA